MKIRLVSLTAFALATFAFAGTAAAQYRGDYAPEYDLAEVVSVDPIIDVVERPVRRDECWEEPVTYREQPRYRSGNDRAPAVLAGIVGGVLGNQFGSGRGRDAATVAGAALGYSMARDSQRNYGGGYYREGREYTSYEQRCATRTEVVADERVSGYNVAYRYNGRIYNTVTDHHPGGQIQVEVAVNPVH